MPQELSQQPLAGDLDQFQYTQEAVTLTVVGVWYLAFWKVRGKVQEQPCVSSVIERRLSAQYLEIGFVHCKHVIESIVVFPAQLARAQALQVVPATPRGCDTAWVRRLASVPIGGPTGIDVYAVLKSAVCNQLPEYTFGGG
jgi:hypothetical protein